MILKKIEKLIFTLTNPFFYKSLIHCLYPLIEVKKIFFNIKKLDYIIDVGSNKGQFSLLVLKYFSKIKIFSFEPQLNLIKIQKKILTNTKFYNICLGNKNFKHALYVTERADSSSLLEPLLINNPIYKTKKKVKVKVKKLDNVLNLPFAKIKLLKIDVQGYELEVLKGSKKNLNGIDYILLEISSKEMYKNQPPKAKIISFLRNKNFKLIKVLNKSYTDDYWQADYLFFNIKKNNEF